jgi:hypothetical protein
MALRDTARLLASLELEDKFSRPADKIDASAGKLEGRFSKLDSGREDRRRDGPRRGHDREGRRGCRCRRDGRRYRPAHKGVHGRHGVARGAQSGQGRTAAVIKSTGGIAGQSTGDIRKLAEEMENLSTNDDKAVQGAENMLLTFTGIGPKAFKPATQAIIDLNAAMGGGDEGLQHTAIQVGKALNDPIKGVGALSASASRSPRSRRRRSRRSSITTRHSTRRRSSSPSSTRSSAVRGRCSAPDRRPRLDDSRMPRRI